MTTWNFNIAQIIDSVKTATVSGILGVHVELCTESSIQNNYYGKLSNSHLNSCASMTCMLAPLTVTISIRLELNSHYELGHYTHLEPWQCIIFTLVRYPVTMHDNIGDLAVLLWYITPC